MNTSSKLALGCAQFGLAYGVASSGGRVSATAAQAILEHALLSGMDTLDTAIAYGDSESVLGALGVEAWKVVTKIPAVPDGCSDIDCWVRGQVQESLHRLGLTRLYGLLLHRPGQLLESTGPALHATLHSLKAEGLVSKIGVSVYGPSELDVLFGKYTFDLVQAPLNILDRRLVESGWADRLKSAGVEIHARSLFLQGLLLMPAEMRPQKFERWADIWVEWQDWLKATGLSPLQACLRYATALECIDRAVVGVDTVWQLKQIVGAIDCILPSMPEFQPLQDDRLINPSNWNQL